MAATAGVMWAADVHICRLPQPGQSFPSAVADKKIQAVNFF